MSIFPWSSAGKPFCLLQVHPLQNLLQNLDFFIRDVCWRLLVLGYNLKDMVINFYLKSRVIADLAQPEMLLPGEW